MHPTDTLEESLECFVGKGPEFRGGLSNHGPMAVEAIVRMGQGQAALPWAVRYREKLEDALSPRWQITDGDWREAVGHPERAADWADFFDRQLKEAPHRDVASRWVPRLLPGLMAAATHGAIRSFHALRALNEQVTDLRTRELAQALGYWATRYQSLPGDPSPLGGTPPEMAAAHLAKLAPQERQPSLISEDMRDLDSEPAFASLVAAVAPESDIAWAFSDLTSIGARAYLANASHEPIALVHAVTAPAAVRELLPLLSPRQQREALAYAWQAVAALIATNAPAGLATQPKTSPPPNEAEIFDRAVVSGDEHAIKLAEAAFRENSINPNPVYFLAAADAGIRLAPD
jgi:hypothetical protein